MLFVAPRSSTPDTEDYATFEAAPLLLRWQTHDPEGGQVPKESHLHAAACFDSRMYVSGGQDDDECVFGELHCYDLTKKQWSTCDTLTHLRSAHVMFALTLSTNASTTSQSANDTFFLLVAGGCYDAKGDVGYLPEIYHLSSEKWLREDPANPKPRWRRSPHTLVKAVRRPSLIATNSCIDSTADFSEGWEAKVASTSGPATLQHIEACDNSSRYLCSSVCSPDHKKVYLFGGINEKEESTNTLAVLDLVTEADVCIGRSRKDCLLLRVEEPTCTGECPGAVYGHGAALSDSCMFIFSGVYATDRVAPYELYQLHLDTYVWRILRCNSQVPSQRLMFAFVCCDGKYCLTLGGAPPYQDDEDCEDEEEEMNPYVACLEAAESSMSEQEVAEVNKRNQVHVSWRQVVMQEGTVQSNVSGFSLVCLDPTWAGVPPTPLSSDQESMFSSADDVLLSSYIAFGGSSRDNGCTNTVMTLDVVHRPHPLSHRYDTAATGEEEAAVQEDDTQDEEAQETDEEEEEEEGLPDERTGIEVYTTASGVVAHQTTPVATDGRKRDTAVAAGAIGESISSACITGRSGGASSSCTADPPPPEGLDDITRLSTGSSLMYAPQPSLEHRQQEILNGSGVPLQPDDLYVSPALASVLAQSLDNMNRMIETNFRELRNRLSSMEQKTSALQHDVQYVKTKVDQMADESSGISVQQKMINATLFASVKQLSERQTH